MPTYDLNQPGNITYVYNPRRSRTYENIISLGFVTVQSYSDITQEATEAKVDS